MSRTQKGFLPFDKLKWDYDINALKWDYDINGKCLQRKHFAPQQAKK